jgi:hypothetical protein
MPEAHRVVDLCTDSELGYLQSRTRFAPGAKLRLDEAYRLAHLPLIVPDHPDVIRSRPDGAYRMGRHDRIFSLVLPVPPDALERSAAYRELEADLRRAPFAHKIAWDLLAKRRARLHATICGSLSKQIPYRVSDEERAAFRRMGPLHVELRGLFSGNINIGRLYLRVYPECRDGENLLRQAQRIIGRPETNLYLVGLFNFVDHLGGAEAEVLQDLIQRWWDRSILTLDVSALWLLSASDDLVLDAMVEEVIPLA